MGQDFYAEGHASSSCARALHQAFSPSYRSCVTHATVFFFPLGGVREKKGEGKIGKGNENLLVIRIARLVRFERCYRCAEQRTMRMCSCAL